MVIWTDHWYVSIYAVWARVGKCVVKLPTADLNLNIYLDLRRHAFNQFNIFLCTLMQHQFNIDLGKCTKGGRHMTEQKKNPCDLLPVLYQRSCLQTSRHKETHIMHQGNWFSVTPKQNKGQLVSSSHTRWVKTPTKADVWPLKTIWQWEVWGKWQRCRSRSIWHDLEGN